MCSHIDMQTHARQITSKVKKGLYCADSSSHFPFRARTNRQTDTTERTTHAGAIQPMWVNIYNIMKYEEAVIQLTCNSLYKRLSIKQSIISQSLSQLKCPFTQHPFNNLSQATFLNTKFKLPSVKTQYLNRNCVDKTKKLSHTYKCLSSWPQESTYQMISQPSLSLK